MFSNVYPLTPELWQRYIGVEQTLAQSESEIQQVKDIFRKALADYYCKLEQTHMLRYYLLKIFA